MKKYIIAGATVLVFSVMSITAYAASTYRPNNGVGAPNGNGTQNTQAQCINSQDCQTECSTEDCTCQGTESQQANQYGEQMNRSNNAMGNGMQNRNENCINQ